MSNKRKKIIAVVLLLISGGLLTYNVLNPYQEEPSNNIFSSSYSTFYDNSSYDNIQTPAVSEDVVEEKQPSQEDIWAEKYRGNQLANGAQPYKALYGKNKRIGTSEIIVTAPSDEDVLVMVKNRNGKVLRHAYIRTGRSYTFHISSGYYQVYFIFGTDWCPEKEAPNGEKGFFLYASTSKDNMMYIDEYKCLKYTLQSMDFGNFRPVEAKDIEAF